MLGVILAAAIAAAAPPPVPPLSDPPRAVDPVICRNEPGQGTRITHRVCQRASEIAQRRRDDHQWLDRMQGNSSAPSMAVLAPMGGGPMH